MTRLLLATALSLLLAPLAPAQVNIEALRAAELEQGWSLAGSAGVEFRAGNTDLLSVEIGSRLNYVAGPHHAFIVGRLNLQSINDVEQVNEHLVHVRYNRTLKTWLIGEAFVQTEHNEQQLLDRRYLVGVGARFMALDNETATVALGVTPMVEYERLDFETDTDEDFIVRVSTYASTRVRVAERVNLFNVVYLQPQVGELDDLRILDEATLAIGITEAVSLNVALRLRYDSEPPETVDGLDVAVRNALVIRL